MQELIDERIPYVESEARYEFGLKPTQNQINGEITYEVSYV
jgi:hypothetical protein